MDNLEHLKARRAVLEDELRQVKDAISIREQKFHPMTTQNRLIVIEGEPFWAIGYRNSFAYAERHWSVVFTNEERRAKRRLASCEYRNDGINHLFELTFPTLTG